MFVHDTTPGAPLYVDENGKKWPSAGKVVKKPPQQIRDWIDNELAGGRTIDPETLSPESLEYLESREAQLA